MIDFDTLEKVGEYKDGNLTWFVNKIENVVYLIRIGEDTYIGSSKNLHRRFSQHISSLRAGKHASPKMQNAFDHIDTFLIYILERPQNIANREQYYIDKYKPSLNTAKAHSWKQNVRGWAWNLFVCHKINLGTFCRRHNLSSTKIKESYCTMIQLAEYSNIPITDLISPDKKMDIIGFFNVHGYLKQVTSLEDLKQLVEDIETGKI